MSHTVVSAQDLPYGGEARRSVRSLIWAGLWSRAAGAADALAAAYDKRRRANRAIAELHALSDHMLADIGVARHDIERIVRQGRDWVEARR